MNHAEAVIDLDAYRRNLRAVSSCAPHAQTMAVVKADGYGHGIIPIASAAHEAGADWLGVATPDEAMLLRAHGIAGPVLCWLATPGTAWGEVIDAGIEVTASSAQQLSEIADSNAQARPRVQLKADTGLSRNGAYGPGWNTLVESAAQLQRQGRIEVTGAWSHFACADEPGAAANDAQEHEFARALEVLGDAGLEAPIRHLANSAATLTRPSAHLDMVRIGIAAYGINPQPGLAHHAELTPVLTLRARLAHVKRVNAGQGVSYGHTWHTSRETTLGLIPIGYADGIHRTGSNQFRLGYDGYPVHQAGTICMDQFIVDLGDYRAECGDWIYLFGTGDHGEPDANSWAAHTGTIGYEVVTRLGGRITRVYRGAS